MRLPSNPSTKIVASCLQINAGVDLAAENIVIVNSVWERSCVDKTQTDPLITKLQYNIYKNMSLSPSPLDSIAVAIAVVVFGRPRPRRRFPII